MDKGTNGSPDTIRQKQTLACQKVKEARQERTYGVLLLTFKNEKCHNLRYRPLRLPVYLPRLRPYSVLILARTL